MDMLEYIFLLLKYYWHMLQVSLLAFKVWLKLFSESTSSPLFVWVPPRIKAGIPAAEDRIQMHTLIILALIGVRKSRAFTGWHTAT